MKILLPLVVAALGFETNLPKLPKLALTGSAAAPAVAKLPRVGWVRGGLVDVTFDRNDWSIRGGSLGAPVDILIDHDKKTVKGGAHGRPVDCVFTWTTDHYSLKGGLIDYAVDWQKQTLVGGINGKPLDLKFHLFEGWIKGEGVDLQFNRISGRIWGGVAGVPIDTVMTNIDISEVIRHFYLLVK